MEQRARRIVSKRLDTEYWIVRDQEERIRQRRSGNSEVIFLESEIALMTSIASDDDLQAIFAAKRLFTNADVCSITASGGLE